MTELTPATRPGTSSAETSAAAEVREDLAAELPRFRAIRDKHGRPVTGDDELLQGLSADGRVLLAFTPDGPPPSWTSWGLD